MTRWFALGLIGLASLALAACFQDSKEDILTKAEAASNRQDLRRVLGDPDDISKTGPIEVWTYEASNGSVSFTLAGDTLTLTTTGQKSN